MEFLYRGFNCHMTVTDAMVPKSLSDDPEQGAEFGDDRVQCGDSDFTFGLSITNTIHSHEYGGNGEPTGGISTTPHFEVAKHYALGGGRFANGQVIRMSIPELKKAGVTIYRVNDCLDTPQYLQMTNIGSISKDHFLKTPLWRRSTSTQTHLPNMS